MDEALGRNHVHDHNATRGVVPAHKLVAQGVNCSLSSNNVLNPFTPFGDCSQIRMANVYANICHVGKKTDMQACFDMITRRPAQLMRLADYGLAPGKSAFHFAMNVTDRPWLAQSCFIAVLNRAALSAMRRAVS